MRRIARKRVPAFLVLMPLGYLAVLLRNYHLGAPVLDEWELMTMFPKFYEGTLSTADLFALHNEHRLLFPRLIMLALARLTGWNQAYETALSVLLAAGALGLAAAQLRATQRQTGRRLVMLIPVLSLLFFSLSQWQNWFMPSQFLLFFHALAAMAAILALSQPALTAKHFAAAIALAVMTSYSFANGLAIWPIGLLCLVIRRSSGRLPRAVVEEALPRDQAATRTSLFFSIIWAAAGAIVIALYLHGYQSPSYHPSPWPNLRHPLGYGLYVLNYLGSPVVNFSVPGATLAGAAGTAILIGGSLIYLKRSGARAAITLLPYWTLALYAVSAAAITGFGRLGFGIEQATSSRYITIANLFWFGNVVLVLLVTEKNWSRYAAAAALALFAVLVGANSVYGTLKWTERYAFRLPAKAELISGGTDENLLQRLHPNPKLVIERREILKKYHLGPFRDKQ